MIVQVRILKFGMVPATMLSVLAHSGMQAGGVTCFGTAQSGERTVLQSV